MVNGLSLKPLLVPHGENLKLLLWYLSSSRSLEAHKAVHTSLYSLAKHYVRKEGPGYGNLGLYNMCAKRLVSLCFANSFAT